MTQVDIRLLDRVLTSLGMSTSLEVLTPSWGVRAKGLNSRYLSHTHYEFSPGHGGPERMVLRNHRYSLVVAEHPPVGISPHHWPLDVDSIYEEEWRGGWVAGALVRDWVLPILRRLQVPQVYWDLDGERLGLWTFHPEVGASNGGVPCFRLAPEVGNQVVETWDLTPDDPEFRCRLGEVEVRVLARELPLPVLRTGAEVWGYRVGTPAPEDRYRARVSIYSGYGWAIVDAMSGPVTLHGPRGETLTLRPEQWLVRFPIPRR